MYEGMTFGRLEAAEKIPQGSIFPMGMGDGSGTKKVTMEKLTEEMGKSLKVGDLEELDTKDKTSLVAAVNEAAKSGGGGGSVDILDSKEEIEANTDPQKVAGALAVKEMFGEVNSNMGGFSFGITADGQPGYRKPGADTVTPFKGDIIVTDISAKFDKTYAKIEPNEDVSVYDMIVMSYYATQWTYNGCVGADEVMAVTTGNNALLAFKNVTTGFYVKRTGSGTGQNIGPVVYGLNYR